MNIPIRNHVNLSAGKSEFALRLWDSGQSLLAAGRYVAARRELEAAERQAFIRRDAALLAGIYLPLLEASRQIRQCCCDGIIAITPGDTMEERPALRELSKTGGMRLVMETSSTGKTRAARDTIKPSGSADVPLESLRLIAHQRSWRITANGQARIGIPVLWTKDSARMIEPADSEHLVAILPPPGIYRPGDPRHTQARETVLLTFEALALQWLKRQGEQDVSWAALAILRKARDIDSACERILMRMIALAEALIIIMRL